jgi:hypothetical protein
MYKSSGVVTSRLANVTDQRLKAVNKIGTRPLANASISIFGRVKYVLNSPILASNFGFETSPNYSMLIDSSTKDRKALM